MDDGVLVTNTASVPKFPSFLLIALDQWKSKRNRMGIAFQGAMSALGV